MKPIINGNIYNAVYSRPVDWDDEKHGECASLHVSELADGTKSSWWKFSFCEKMKILFGCPLRLTIISKHMPPVSLNITKDWK